jgi:Dual specificity phosphatase, catalytic domain
MNDSAKTLDLPLPNTYWVVPGRLLAGEYPIGEGAADSRARLALLREHRVNSFIDLTEERELPAYRHMLPVHTQYLRFPVPDESVPSNLSIFNDLLVKIHSLVESKRCVYVHCRAGIGRTGLTIGCYLGQIGGDGKAALAELNRLWKQSARSQSWPTVPQTKAQAEFIRQWPKLAKNL